MIGARLLSYLALSLLVAAAPQIDVSGARQRIPNWKKELKYIFVLVMENRSYDNLMGGMTYTKDLDGVLKHPMCYPVNLTDPHNHECVRPRPHDHNSVMQDPQHGSSPSFYEMFGTFEEDLDAIHRGKMKPDMSGYLTMQRLTHGNESVEAASDAINYYNPKHIPTLTALAEEYTHFDRWFSGVPGPTGPNRAMLTSGTAAGHGQNDADFGASRLFQKSIFELLTEFNVTWRNYHDGSGTGPDSHYYNWTKATGHDKTNIFPHAVFFEDLANDNLATFNYMNPSCCNNMTTSMHPSGLVSDGEKFIKDIYDAIHASDIWEQSLFIITFDEGGGFADHVPPPLAPRPDNLTYTEKALDGSNYTLDYSFLGSRVPTFLISPWLPKGHVIHKGKNNGKEFSATSIIKFLCNLFDMPDLTPRTAWSSTWEDQFLDKPRKNTLKKLPDPIVFVEG